MFSGIVEATGHVMAATPRAGVLEIWIERPNIFNDLAEGHSISVDGVCLTVESFTPEKIQFALGPETLKVTGWTVQNVLGRVVNLERSLRFEDRIHGHLVTGHVDSVGRVSEIHKEGESVKLSVDYPEVLQAYIWPKGSIAVSGVSLTLNQVSGTSFSVGLIPETLKRTSLGQLRTNDPVNLEVDNMARGLVHFQRISEHLNQKVEKEQNL